MRFFKLKEKLADQLVFTSHDIRKIDGSFSYQRLAEWQRKGYIQKIVKGYYMFSDRPLAEEDLFAIANRIYAPSYISLESALRYYNFIPEGVFRIISVSTRKTNRIEVKTGVFEYRRIKPAAFFGYRVAGTGARKFRIATPEKALLDYFYFRSDLKNKADVESLRINREELVERIDPNRLRSDLRAMCNKSLARRMENFLTSLDHA